MTRPVSSEDKPIEFVGSDGVTYSGFYWRERERGESFLHVRSSDLRDCTDRAISGHETAEEPDLLAEGLLKELVHRNR